MKIYDHKNFICKRQNKALKCVTKKLIKTVLKLHYYLNS